MGSGVLQNGKIYICDLSAAQNIGARFFLQEYEKEGAEGLPSTPKRTLSTLRALVYNVKIAESKRFPALLSFKSNSGFKAVYGEDWKTVFGKRKIYVWYFELSQRETT